MNGYETSALEQSATKRDLSQLRAELDRNIDYARRLGFMAHNVADAVFGSVPTAVGTSQSANDRPPPPLAELIEQLGYALQSIDDGLQRL